MTTAPTDRSRRPARTELAGLALALAVGVALRLAAAWNQSLIVDEFHSHFHATQPDLGVFFQTLLSDNHPPLSFLAFRFAFALVGQEAFAMRLLSVAFGAAAIGLVFALARRLPWGPARWLAPLLLAASSLHLDVTSDVRMYGLHALCVAGTLHALVSALEDGRRRWALAAWLWVGVHTHYYFLHYAIVLGATSLALAIFGPRYRRPVRSLVAPVAAAALLSLPWYGWGFVQQLAHGEMPGGRTISLGRWAESLAHQLYLNLSLGGETWRLAYLGGAALSLLLGACGFVALVRRGLGEGQYALPALLGAAAFLVPTWAALVAWVHLRAGFNWNYLSASAAPLCVLIAGAWSGRSVLARAGRIPLLWVLATALHLSWKNAFWVGPEDYRGAVERIVLTAEPEDAVISAEIQPSLFPLGLAWRYYAPRLAAEHGRPLPERLPVDHSRELDDPTRLDRFERVFLLDRTLPPKSPLFTQLRGRFERESVQRELGWGIAVWTFELAPADDSNP